MHRRTSRSLFANRPARRAARARTKAERVSQRSQERVYAMQRKRESRLQRWRRAFPTRFVPVNLTRFSALWAAVLSLFSDALTPPTFRRRASAGARSRVGGMRYFQPLEERALLAADVYVDDDWSSFAIGDDPDGAGPAIAIGTDAFATIQEGINNIDDMGTLHVAAGVYEESATTTTASADSSVTEFAIAADAGAVLQSPAGSPFTLFENDVTLAITGLTLRASNSGDTIFSDTGSLTFDGSNEIQISVAESNVGNLTSFELTIDGSPITSLLAGDTKGSVSAAGAEITYTPVTTTEGPTDATFDFTTDDGLSGTVNVTITPVNDAPVVTAGGGANPVFNESDGIAVVVDSGVTVEDVDDTNIELATVEITAGFDANDVLEVTAPGFTVDYTAGKLTIDGAGTLAEYEALLQSVTFKNTGADPTSASDSRTITFTVNDGDANSAAATASVDINAVNDAPVEEKNIGRTVAEMGSARITTNHLEYSDAEDDGTPANIVYQIVSITGDISLRIGNGSGGSTPSILGVNDTFTQANLQTTADGVDRLFVDHGGFDELSAGFTFVVRDNGDVDGTDPLSNEVSGSFAITVSPENDLPTVSLNNGLTVDEGTLDVALDSMTMLSADDVDDTNADLVYTIVSVPSNGTLKLNGVALVDNDTFTQLQLDNGEVTYSQDTPNQSSDSFTFNVSDDEPSTSADEIFNITINEINDPLVISTNLGLTVVEGGSQSLDTRLDTTDLDTADADIVYTVDAVPANGTLYLNGTALEVNDTFTQVELDAGDVSYTHNGGETTSDTFEFSVTDGGTTLTENFFAITVTPVNDAPEVSAPMDLSAVEETTTVLSGVFSITDVDLPEQTLTVTLSVNDGELAVPGTPADVVVGGTPTALTLTGLAGAITAALNGGEVTYTGNLDIAGDNADLLTIDVFDGTTTTSTTANIDIEDVNDAPTFDALVDPIAVDEDATEVTVPDFLMGVDTVEAGQDYTITVTSDNPSLFAPGGQPSIDKMSGDLTYTPALNAFGTATVTVTVTDDGLAGTTGGPASTSDTFDIVINPIVDAPAVTTNDLTINEGDSVTLTTSSLSVVDPDTAAADLDIEATSVPAGLQLELAGDEGVAITTFTYEQLQLGQVKLVDLDPAGLIGSGTIEFSVTDNDTPSETASLLVNVTPVNDPPVVDNSATTVEVFTEDGAAAAIAGMLSISDVDSTELDSATITLVDIQDGDLIEVDPAPAMSPITIDDSAAATTGVITLTGTATLAEYEAILRTLKFSNSTSDPDVNGTKDSRMVKIEVTDAEGAAGEETITVDVDAVNDAPVLTSANEGQTLTYTEDTAAITLFGDLSIADDDGLLNETFESATLTITNFVSGQDAVSFTPVTGLTVVLDDTTTPGTMVVSITSDALGTMDASAYEALLQSITFENTSDAPTASPNRDVALVVMDGEDPSNTLTASIEVVPVSDPLVEDTNSPLTIGEGSNNADGNYITDAVLKVTDADGIPASDITYTLTEIKRADDSDGSDLVQIRLRETGPTSNTVITSFTQEDINNTDVSGAGNTHAGIQVRSLGVDATPGNDVAILVFEVTNSQSDTPITVELTVNIERVNDTPSNNDGPGTVTLNEEVDGNALPQVIDGFNYTDEETAAGDLTILITGVSNLADGVLTVDGVEYDGSTDLPIKQSDIALGKLTFTHTNTAEGQTPITVDFQVMDEAVDALAAKTRGGQSFTIEFTPQNDSPIAADDTFSVGEDDADATGSVLSDNGNGDDTDPEDDTPLEVIAVDGVAASVGMEIAMGDGLLTVNADGTFAFKPNGGYETLDDGDTAEVTFTYTVEDSLDKSHPTISSATATITISGANDAPTLVDPNPVDAGMLSVAENLPAGTVVSEIVVEDVDDGETLTLDFVAPNSEFEIVAKAGSPGTFELKTLVSFDAENDGPFTFDIQGSDGDLSTGTLSLTVTIDDVNDNPVVDVNAGATVLEGGSVNLSDAVLSASDDEDLDAVTYMVVDGPTNGSLNVSTFSQADLVAGNVVTYTHDGGETVADSFTFKVLDNNDPAGESSVQTFDLTVTPVNDTPVATPNPLSIEVDKDSTITFDALAIVDAVEDGQTLSLTGVSATSVGGSSVLATLGTGMITYTPNGSVGSDSFTYTVKDNGGTANGAIDTVTVTVNVTIVDLAPDAKDDNASVTEGGTTTVDLFADNGNGEDFSGQSGAPTLVTVAGVAFSNGMEITPSTPGSTLTGGTLKHISGGEFEYTSDLAEEISQEVFDYTITDGTTPDTATVTIDIVDVADVVPFISSFSGDTAGSEGDTLSFSVVATDGDSDPTLTYDWDFGDGTQIFGATASESHTYTEKGNYTVTVTVSDRGQSASASAGVTIIDDVAPEVASVRVGSLDWSTSFVDFVDPSMGLGYEVADSEAPLPWVNLDVIHVTFSEEVQKIGGGTITADDIQLIGVNSSPSIASFTYDNVSFTATIVLFDPIGAEKLLVYVDGSDVEDDAGNSVDGSDSTRIDIVPGDANRSSLVSPTDLGFANGKKLLGTGDAGYSIYADVNGSGTVTGTDVNDIRLRQFSALPAGSPMAPAPAPALAASPISDPVSVELVESSVAPAPIVESAPAADPVLFVIADSPAQTLIAQPILGETDAYSHQDQSLLLYLQESGSLSEDADSLTGEEEDAEENETEEERDEAIGQLFGSAF